MSRSRVGVGVGVVTIGATGVGWLAAPGWTVVAVVVATTVVVVAARRRHRRRHLDRHLIAPTVAALSRAVGAPVSVSVSSAMRQAIPRPVRRHGPVSAAVRAWWSGLGPVRGAANVRAKAAAVAEVATTSGLARRRPAEIVMRAEVPYLGDDARAWCHAVVAAKLAPGPLSVRWQLRGPVVVATWRPKAHPPRTVDTSRVTTMLATMGDGQLYIGDGAAGPVVVDIDTDSPHIGMSAGSGAGKSVLAASLAAQTLARGGRVVVIDPKTSSHRWAAGRRDVAYATTPEQIHAALVRLADLVDRRNAHPDRQYRRVLVIVEEVNSATARLRGWWDDNRPTGGPRVSPAIRALEMVSHQGRSARVHLVAIAQQLTARSIGGEARENLGVRLLARHTTNTWRMLTPEVPRPAPSRHPGRWHAVIGGEVTEVQVPHVTPADARRIAGPAMSPVSPVSPTLDAPPVTCDVPGDTAPTGDKLTLSEAVAQGVIPWSREAAKKRLQRSPTRPEPVGRQAQADLYRRADLAAWVERETARRA